MEDNNTARLNNRHWITRHFGSKSHTIPNLQVLKFLDNLVGIMNITAEQVFEPFVAVESAPSLSYLYEPRPDVSDRSLNGNRISVLPLWMWYQVVAR